MLQLIVGNSRLWLNLHQLIVNGTFVMGTAGCPITEPITVTIPGGNETFGVDISRDGSYDVHGLVKVRHSSSSVGVSCSDWVLQ